ncbi:hypothetical protein HMPREF0491_02932 [Lachnospiraceae oral taxon 107 str. F0167]|jgi:hypothetical protein|nr:hypothetical protein HMPREF0491_02932 [Lachnospiraceae oral taxon 107 str. F0167]
MIRKYYLISQQPGLYPLPRTIDWNKVVDKTFLTESLSYKQPMISSVLVKKSDTVETIYPDILFIDFIPVFSEKAIEVLSIYEPSMTVKHINFIEEAGDDIKLYNIPILKEIDCLSEKTIFKCGRQIDKGVLIKENIPDLSIFKIAGEIDRERVVIRTDFAESFLKRRLKGVALRRLEVV